MKKVCLPNIEIECIRRKMSRADLADLLGVTYQTVKNWQSGRTEIPMSKLIQLSGIWNVSIDYLLGLETGQVEKRA